MEKRKITEEELAERRKNMRDAEILASLDNNSEYSEEYINLKNQYLNGEITIVELKKKFLELWHMNNTFTSILKKPTENKF